MTHPPVTFEETIPDRALVASALGLTEADLAPGVPLQVATTGNPFLFVGLRNRGAVDAASSDASRLNRIFAGRDPRAVLMFAADGPGKLFSRMFAPHLLGISEDAATGSAAGPLGAFAVKHGLVPRGASVSLVNEQGTKMGRQSFLHVELAYGSDRDIPTKIEVGGSVVPVVSGELTLPEVKR